MADLARRQPHEVFLDWSLKYGDTVAFRILGRPRLLLNDPAMVGEVLDTHHDAFYKDSPVDELRPIVRRSVFIANGEEWSFKRPRHPFSSAWLDRWMAEVLPQVRDLMVGRIAGWNGRVEIVEALRRLAFDCFSIAVLGELLDDEHYNAHNALYDDAALRLQLGAVFKPITLNPLAPLNRHIWWSGIADRVKAPRDPDARDLLSRIKVWGTGLSEEQLVDEIGTIFLAGAGPVAVAMTVILYELAGHRKQAEELTKATGPLASSQFDLADLREQTLVAHVVDEALRLWPTVSVLTRKPKAPVKVGDLEIPEDVEIILSPWAMHRNPQRWPEPLAFSPARFRTSPSPWTYMPFGLGPRTCVGRPWALFLAQLFTTLTTSRLRLARTDDGLHLRFYAGFSKPDGPVHLQVSRQ
ncbi:cytochrome P450 [Sorangium sp. So ce134]